MNETLRQIELSLSSYLSFTILIFFLHGENKLFRPTIRNVLYFFSYNKYTEYEYHVYWNPRLIISFTACSFIIADNGHKLWKEERKGL